MRHQPTIATIVEGQGEVAAIPVLLQRMLAEIVPGTWIDTPRPHRRGRDELLSPGGVERAVATVAEQSGPATGVLILVDADDDCPFEVAPPLLDRARSARTDLQSAVVLANREFEAWYLAAAPSLAGVRGLAADLARPADPESPRDCKGWLSERRTDRRPYKPAADQAALAAVFDLAMAREYSPSFAKLWRDVESLARSVTA